MEVIINKPISTTFEDLDYGTIFLYQHYYCMKIFSNETDSAVGLIVDNNSGEFMDTIYINYNEPIYQTYPDSKLIIE